MFASYPVLTVSHCASLSCVLYPVGQLEEKKIDLRFLEAGVQTVVDRLDATGIGDEDVND